MFTWVTFTELFQYATFTELFEYATFMFSGEQTIMLTVMLIYEAVWVKTQMIKVVHDLRGSLDFID